MKNIVLLLVVLLAASAAGFAAGDDARPVPTTPVARAALPAGTAIRMTLEAPLSTDNKRGDRFSGRVSQPVLLAGRTIIPAGATVEGQVLRASAPRRIKGKPSIDLRPETVKLPDGERLPIRAVVVDTGKPGALDVDEEGRIRGAGRSPTDNRELLIGTGAGAAAGAAVAGGGGALVGAAAGATATTTHWLARHRSLTIPAGTEIILELGRPLEIASK